MCVCICLCEEDAHVYLRACGSDCVFEREVQFLMGPQGGTKMILGQQKEIFPDSTALEVQSKNTNATIKILHK